MERLDSTEMIGHKPIFSIATGKCLFCNDALSWLLEVVKDHTIRILLIWYVDPFLLPA